jgi:hypothetical protein
MDNKQTKNKNNKPNKTLSLYSYYSDKYILEHFIVEMVCSFQCQSSFIGILKTIIFLFTILTFSKGYGHLQALHDRRQLLVHVSSNNFWTSRPIFMKYGILKEKWTIQYVFIK